MKTRVFAKKRYLNAEINYRTPTVILPFRHEDLIRGCVRIVENHGSIRKPASGENYHDQSQHFDYLQRSIVISGRLRSCESLHQSILSDR